MVLYSYLRERLKHAVRFRHKRGFGVHSPFMFHLILQVIRDRERQYVYPPEADRGKRIGYRKRKFCRLLFRLASYLHTERVLCLSTRPGKIIAYLQAVPGVREITTEPCNIADSDFVYIGNDARTLLQSCLSGFIEECGRSRKCIVITDIHRNSFNADLWLQLRGKATVTVDMMWYGLLFFDEKLQKGRYNLII